MARSRSLAVRFKVIRKFPFQFNFPDERYVAVGHDLLL